MSRQTLDCSVRTSEHKCLISLSSFWLTLRLFGQLSVLYSQTSLLIYLLCINVSALQHFSSFMAELDKLAYSDQKAYRENHKETDRREETDPYRTLPLSWSSMMHWDSQWLEVGHQPSSTLSCGLELNTLCLASRPWVNVQNRRTGL